jgi:CBS domain containing-hemolysin-like protein
MDDGSWLSPLVLVVSLVFYFYLRLAEEGLTRNGRGIGAAKISREPPGIVWLLRIASVLAAATALLAYLFTNDIASPALLALAAFLLLVCFGLLRQMAAFAASQLPDLAAKLAKPLRFLVRTEQLLPGVVPPLTPQNSQLRDDQASEDAPFLTEEQEARLDDREQQMIRSILTLEATTVREIMRPRVDVVAVDKNASMKEAADLMLSRGHSRMPVYESSLDTVVGVVHVRDVLRHMGQQAPNQTVAEVVRPAFFVPETKRLDNLLQEFQNNRLHMAIVVDEFGGTEGIVTLEDLLEEIVGEIEDEFSRPEPQIALRDDGSALVDAGVGLDSFNDAMGTSLSMGGIDTIGGYVHGTLGRIARSGDIVKADGLSIKVVIAVGRRIRKLLVTRAENANPQLPETENKN